MCVHAACISSMEQFSSRCLLQLCVSMAEPSRTCVLHGVLLNHSSSSFTSLQTGGGSHKCAACSAGMRLRMCACASRILARTRAETRTDTGTETELETGMLTGMHAIAKLLARDAKVEVQVVKDTVDEALLMQETDWPLCCLISSAAAMICDPVSCKLHPLLHLKSAPGLALTPGFAARYPPTCMSGALWLSLA